MPKGTPPGTDRGAVAERDRPAYTSVVAKRDPRASSASNRGRHATQIKAAWRRLARTHHPDLTGDDPAASRVATRKMAEINEAYAALTRDGSADGRIGGRRTWRMRRPAARRPAGPKPSRPVTGRVDTSATFRARNSVAHGRRREHILPGQAPLRPRVVDRRAAASLHPDGSGRPRPDPPLPSADAAVAGGCERPSTSGSSTVTRSARSPRSSRPTSTGSRAPSRAIRTSWPRHAWSRPTWIGGGSSVGPVRRRSVPGRSA